MNPTTHLIAQFQHIVCQCLSYDEYKAAMYFSTHEKRKIVLEYAKQFAKDLYIERIKYTTCEITFRNGSKLWLRHAQTEGSVYHKVWIDESDNIDIGLYQHLKSRERL